MKKKNVFLFCQVILILIGVNSKAQTAGDYFFSSSQIHSIYLTFSQINWWDSLVSSYLNDSYIECEAIIDGNYYTSIGAKFKGNSSYNNPSDKKSMKLDFNYYVSGENVDGLKKLNLNNCFKDPSFMREKVFLDYLAMNDITAPRCTYANVYLNNQHWGLYTVVEEVDKTFLDDRFGNDDGNLFKGDPHGDLKWLGSTESLYYLHYELHTNETLNDWSDLVQFIDIINNSGSGFGDSIDAYLNTEGWLKAWAASIISANLDSYQGSGHNYFLYHNTNPDRFEWIIWDVNEAFGNFQMGLSLSQLETLSVTYISPPSTSRPLQNNMLTDPDLYDQYMNTVCELMNNGWDTLTLYPLIDSIAEWIRADVYADNNKFYTNQQFEDNIEQDVSATGGSGGFTIPGLKPFIASRYNSIWSELNAWGCFNTSLDEVIAPESILLFPNPAKEELKVQMQPSFIGNEIIVYDATGRKVISNSVAGEFTTIPISSLSNGMYFLSIGNEINQKFVKQ